MSTTTELTDEVCELAGGKLWEKNGIRRWYFNVFPVEVGIRYRHGYTDEEANTYVSLKTHSDALYYLKSTKVFVEDGALYIKEPQTKVKAADVLNLKERIIRTVKDRLENAKKGKRYRAPMESRIDD